MIFSEFWHIFLLAPSVPKNFFYLFLGEHALIQAFLEVQYTTAIQCHSGEIFPLGKAILVDNNTLVDWIFMTIADTAASGLKACIQ